MCVDPVSISQCCALKNREDFLHSSMYGVNMIRLKDLPIQELRSRTLCTVLEELFILSVSNMLCLSKCECVPITVHTLFCLPSV